MRPVQPVKIPPLGLTAESVPFDKGVNPAMPDFLTPGFARRPQPHLSGNHWQPPCALSRRKRFIVRLHHSGPPSGIRHPQFRTCLAQATACHRIPEHPCLHSSHTSAPASLTA